MIRPTVITRPNWLKKPGASEFSRFYPESAMRRGVGGGATLNCSVAANGAIQACSVVDENPAEEGFGKAALKLSKYFKMSPQTENGQAVIAGVHGKEVGGQALTVAEARPRKSEARGPRA